MMKNTNESILLGDSILHLVRANNFIKRFVGLMLKASLPANEAFLLAPCSSIHTAFMRFSIDVIYLDKQGCIRGLVKNLPPWRASIGPKHTYQTLELTAGSIEQLSLRVGQHIFNKPQHRICLNNEPQL